MKKKQTKHQLQSLVQVQSMTCAHMGSKSCIFWRVFRRRHAADVKLYRKKTHRKQQQLVDAAPGPNKWDLVHFVQGDVNVVHLGTF